MSELFRTNEIKTAEAWQAAIAEFIATFSFVFLASGAVVVAINMVGQGDLTVSTLILIALAHGLAITILVACTGRVSGGHINPAVTISMMATKKMGLSKGLMYVIAQLLGATIGSYLLMIIIPETIQGNLGAHALAANIDPATGLVIEILLTFFLVFVIFATAVDPKGVSQLAPLAIGSVVMVDILMGGPLTGASMNPARSFGPALVSGQWLDHWIYWLGPIIGGIVAATLYECVFIRWREEKSA